MDILTNLILVCAIAVLFFSLLFTRNPYIFVSLIVLSLSGLIIGFNDPLYLTTGWNTSLTYALDGTISGSITTPITEPYETYNYIFLLYYLMGMVVSVLYWTMEEKVKKNNDFQ